LKTVLIPLFGGREKSFFVLTRNEWRLPCLLLPRILNANAILLKYLFKKLEGVPRYLGMPSNNIPITVNNLKT
jgi:hypothetical protein